MIRSLYAQVSRAVGCLATLPSPLQQTLRLWADERILGRLRVVCQTRGGYLRNAC